MLVLFVEDEKTLAVLVMEYLASHGVECDYYANGNAALEQALNQTYDAMILDINLPGLNGFDLCKSLREKGVNTPCIMLTARHSLDDKVIGFESGTDDYLVKPFAMQELLVRLNALVSRGQQGKQLIIDDLRVDVSKRQAKRGEHVLTLSPDEWSLLLLLARHAPAVIEKATIEEHIWPDGLPSPDAYKMLVYRLRKTLDTDGLPPLLQTVRGVGLALRSKDS